MKEVERAKVSCYSRYGAYGLFELDVWFKGDSERYIKTVGERELNKLSSAGKRGTFGKPQKYLDTDEGKRWLEKKLQKEEEDQC